MINLEESKTSPVILCLSVPGGIDSVSILGKQQQWKGFYCQSPPGQATRSFISFVFPTEYEYILVPAY